MNLETIELVEAVDFKNPYCMCRVQEGIVRILGYQFSMGAQIRTEVQSSCAASSKSALPSQKSGPRRLLSRSCTYRSLESMPWLAAWAPVQWWVCFYRLLMHRGPRTSGLDLEDNPSEKRSVKVIEG